VGTVYKALFGEEYVEEKSAIGELSGIYYKSAFFEEADKLLKQQSLEQEFCLVVVDIEHFKLFNEWYGRETGDRFLMDIATELRRNCSSGVGVTGYMGEDDFVLPLTGEWRDALSRKKYEGRVCVASQTAIILEFCK
jgi:diguanylate cyclase (GGDEF)-like protein